MVIKVITEEETSAESRILNYILIFTVIFAIAVLAFYFFVRSDINKVQAKIDKNNNQLKVKTEEEKGLEDRAALYAQKIKDFSAFLDSHRLNTNLLKFLERKIHPQVVISKLQINSELSRVQLECQAETYEALSQQHQIFQQARGLVRDASLNTISLTENGKIRFSMSLDLDPKIFSGDLDEKTFSE